MTLDEMIAAGLFAGQTLERNGRMAEYLVDGRRLGEKVLKTRSGSQNDAYMSKSVSEVMQAATLFALIGLDDLAIRSLDAGGRRLESPDLDVRFGNGTCVGIELARAISSDRASHDAEMNRVRTAVADRIDLDPDFAKAFGPFYLSLSIGGPDPHPVHRPLRKDESFILIDEVVKFVSAGFHRQASSGHRVPKQYPSLFAREAEFQSSPIASGPHFSFNDGGSSVSLSDQHPEVLRVLNAHRKQAAKYRSGTTWLILLIADSFEFLRNTIAVVKKAHPSIEPFERVYLFDSATRFEILS